MRSLLALGARRLGVRSIVVLLSLAMPVMARAQVTVPSPQFPTIQSAINAVIAGTLASGSVINVNPGTYVEALVVNGTSRSFTVSGAGAGSTVISGGGSRPLFINQSTGAIRFQGVTLTGGAVSGLFGGGFLVNASSNVTFANCTVSQNSASIAGGAGTIDVSSVVTIDSCTISANVATGVGAPGDGGGLFVRQGSQLTCRNCTITGNLSARNGGGLIVSASTAVFEGGTFQGNMAGNFGGGGFFEQGAVGTFTGVTVQGNTSGVNAAAFGTFAGGGGGLAFTASSGTFQSGRVTGNQSRSSGGGLYMQAAYAVPRGTLVVVDAEVDNNSVTRFGPNEPPAVGGGIYIEANVLAQVTRTRIHNNTSNGGGGMAIDYGGRFDINSSFIESNQATDVTPIIDVSGQGGGILTGSASPPGLPPSPGATLNLIDSVVRNNSARIGGGIKTSGDNVCGGGPCGFGVAVMANLGLTRTLVDSNTAVDIGGGIHTDRSNVTITDSQILRNRITGASAVLRAGAGVSLFESFATISGSTLANNSTNDRGGAVFSGNRGGLTVNGSNLYNNSAGVSAAQGGGAIFVGGPAGLVPTGSVQASVIADNSSPQIKEDSSCASLAYTGNHLASLSGGDFYQSTCAVPGAVTTAAAFDTIQNHTGNDGDPPTFLSFASRPGAGASVLAWSVARATAISITGVGSVDAPTGTADVPAPSSATQFTLTANNPDRTAMVTVQEDQGGTPPPPPPPPNVPTLTVQINGTSYQTGGTLILTATLTPGSTPTLVDAYIVVQIPGGSMLSILLGGVTVPGIAPIATGLTPFSISQELLRYTFSGTEPAGMYLFQSALVQAGTGTIIGTIAQTPFTYTR